MDKKDLISMQDEAVKAAEELEKYQLELKAEVEGEAVIARKLMGDKISPSAVYLNDIYEEVLSPVERAFLIKFALNTIKKTAEGIK